MQLLIHALTLPTLKLGVDEWLYPTENHGCNFLSVPYPQWISVKEAPVYDDMNYISQIHIFMNYIV